VHAKARIYRRFGKDYLADVEPTVLRHYARQLEHRLRESDAEVILSLDKMPIAYLETSKPIVYFWDCTWAGNLEYPWFAGLPTSAIELGHEMERRALRNCTLAVFSSEWARQSALDDYGTDLNKTAVIPLGANVEVTRTEADVARIVEARSRDKLELLWLGVDWKRKGGDLAFEIAHEMNRRGISTTLNVVGCAPEIAEMPSFVQTLGFIDKRTSRSLLEELFSRAHFLVLPSIAEASACVMCEASSFGTPSLSRRIGGIPGTVRDGVNGQLFDRQAPATEYCDYIVKSLGDWDHYKALCMSSFAEFEQNLNWDNTAKLMVELVREQVL
jgi:glycosyltransferase involved in cell wall biosynthesis